MINERKQISILDIYVQKKQYPFDPVKVVDCLFWLIIQIVLSNF